MGRFFRFCLSSWWAAPLGMVASPLAACGGFIGLLSVRALVAVPAGADAAGSSDAEMTGWMSVFWIFFVLGAGAALLFAGLSVAAIARALWRRQWRLAAAVAGACVLFPGLIALGLLAFDLLIGGPEEVYGLPPEADNVAECNVP